MITLYNFLESFRHESSARPIGESLGSKARTTLKDFVVYFKSLDQRIMAGASLEVKDYVEIQASKIADLRPYSNMVTVVIDGEDILIHGINKSSWTRFFPVEGGYGQDHGLKSIDLNPNCVVFVCPNMGDENTATGNAQIFMADPKRVAKWWKYFTHTISTKLDKIFQESSKEHSSSGDTEEGYTISRWFDKTDAKKVLSRGEYSEVYTLVKMLNSFHTKVKDRASQSNVLYTVNTWFTNNKHERFHFPSLYTSLRKIKGHVQEDFREVLERFAGRVESVYNYKW